jgi:hypothetical protein
MQIRLIHHVYAKAKRNKKKEEEGRRCGMQQATVVIN